MVKVPHVRGENLERDRAKKERKHRSPSPVDIKELVQLQSQVYQIPVLKSANRLSDSDQNNYPYSVQNSVDLRGARRRDLSETREEGRRRKEHETQNSNNEPNQAFRPAGQLENSRGTLLNKINQHTIRSKSPQYDPYNYMKQKDASPNKTPNEEGNKQIKKPHEAGIEPNHAEIHKIAKAPVISFRAVGNINQNHHLTNKQNTDIGDDIKDNPNHTQSSSKKFLSNEVQPKKMDIDHNISSVAKVDSSDPKNSNPDEIGQQNTGDTKRTNTIQTNHSKPNELPQTNDNPFPVGQRDTANFPGADPRNLPNGAENKHTHPASFGQFPLNINNTKSSIMPILGQKTEVSGPSSLTTEQRSLARAKDIDAHIQDLVRTRNKSPSINIQDNSKQKRSHSEKANTRIKIDPAEMVQKISKNLLGFIKTNSKYLPELEDVKVMNKQYGPIKSFAVSTHRGTVRNYNEDRVSVLLNAHQKLSRNLPTA